MVWKAAELKRSAECAPKVDKTAEVGRWILLTWHFGTLLLTFLLLTTERV